MPQGWVQSVPSIAPLPRANYTHGGYESAAPCQYIYVGNTYGKSIWGVTIAATKESWIFSRTRCQVGFVVASPKLSAIYQW